MIKINVPQTVKDALNIYDINKLLTRTIPEDYKITPTTLQIYKRTVKFDTPVEINLNEDALKILNNYCANMNEPQWIEILAFLVDMACDCSKINSKDIDTVLDIFYTASSKDQTAILHAYSESLYCQDNLDMGDVAYFLISQDGQELLKELNLNK